jgi:hypothetical protein
MSKKITSLMIIENFIRFLDGGDGTVVARFGGGRR